MNKNSVRVLGCLAIIFTVFSLIVFLVPFHKSQIFWIAYAFAGLALLFQVYVAQLINVNSKDIKSRFYRAPIARIGVIYLPAQLLLSVAEMFFSKVLPSWLVIIINIIILTAAVIGCIAADAAREEIEKQDTSLKQDTYTMRNLQSVSSAMVKMCTHPDIKKEIQKVADEIKYSDPVSCNETISLEKEISQLLTEMHNKVMEANLQSVTIVAQKILILLIERNRICKQNKQFGR